MPIFPRYRGKNDTLFKALKVVCWGHSSQLHAVSRNLYQSCHTFLSLFLFLFELLAEFLMFLGDLVDLIFVVDDLPRIFKHIFLHLVDNYLLSIVRNTRSSYYFSLILVSSWICLILGKRVSTCWRWLICVRWLCFKVDFCPGWSRSLSSEGPSAQFPLFK